MAKHTIKLKKYSDVIEEYEASASGIYPGCLLELDAADMVKNHATAGGNVLPMFALEDELQGRGIDDVFASGEKIQVWVPYRGDIVLAILADGQTINKGDFLESDGAGGVQKHTPDEGSQASIYQNAIVGVALDQLSTAAGSEDSDINFLSIKRRIPVRII